VQCPRCNYEWDVRQSPCPHCNLHLRVSGLQETTNRQQTQQMNVSQPEGTLFSTGDRITPVRSSYLLELESDKSIQSQIPMPLNGHQLSRSLSSNLLSPGKMASPPPDKPNRSSVPPISSAGTLFPSSVQEDMQPLLPGTLLHRGHYRLEKKLHKREWPLGIIETIWAALDTRTANLSIIHELSLPNALPKEAQSIPYTATKVFTSIGRNAHILPLNDVFSEKGRNFFVFESIDGLSLVKLLSNSNGKLPERDVVTCCLQIVELLKTCSQQSPPLLHGNIRPEYIARRSTDSQYILTNFSVALAGGLIQIMKDMGKSSLLEGKMDVRIDLHALLRVAHYMATGYWLPNTGIEASSTSLVGAGSVLSPQFRVILLKGLHAPFHQRYQTLAELHQDLFALYERDKKVSSSSPTPQPSLAMRESPWSFAPMVQTTQNPPADGIVSSQPMKKLSEYTLLLPLPEELPSLKEVDDMRNAILWFTGMLLCLLLLLGPGLL
jgi:hypothetical protein